MVTQVQQQQQPPEGVEHQIEQKSNNVGVQEDQNVENYENTCEQNRHVVSINIDSPEDCQSTVAYSTGNTVVEITEEHSVDSYSTKTSDVDDDEDEDEEEDEESDLDNGGWVMDAPIAVANNTGDLALPTADPSNFGDVCVKNSSNVHLGNKIFYKGPLTIKQFVYTNPSSTNAVQDQNDLPRNDPRFSDACASDFSGGKDEQSPRRPMLAGSTDLYKGG